MKIKLIHTIISSPLGFQRYDPKHKSPINSTT